MGQITGPHLCTGLAQTHINGYLYLISGHMRGNRGFIISGQALAILCDHHPANTEFVAVLQDLLLS